MPTRVIHRYSNGALVDHHVTQERHSFLKKQLRISVKINMKHSLSILNSRSFGTPLLVAASIALASCAAPFQTQLLSRLPASDPNAAATSSRQLSDAERKHAAEIDEQVLKEQNQAIANRAAAAAAIKAARAAAYYSSPLLYGGYYHGMPRWGATIPLMPGIRWDWR